MKIFILLPVLFFPLFFPGFNVIAQADTLKYADVKVIVPSIKKKPRTSYFLFSAGYQVPAKYKLPMIPENPYNIDVTGDLNVKVPGWFAGIGLMKRTRSRFEAGLLVDYYRASTPVAYAGQRSTSDWVYERSGSTNYFTDVFENNIDRVSEVFTVRATVRYKLPLGNFRIWGGLAPGTFASNIRFMEEGNSEPLGRYMDTSLGLNYQAGMDYMIKNQKGKDKAAFSLFADFSGPKVEESFISLFRPGWIFKNTEGNYVINPFRVGFCVGLY